MKQKILYILVLIAALIGGNGEAWAQTQKTSYVLDESAEVEIMDDGSKKKPKTYEFNTGKTLTFEYKKRRSAGTGVITLSAYDANGNALINEKKFSLTTSYQNATVDLPDGVTKITFNSVKENIFNTYEKYIKNVKVTRATTLTPSPSSIDWGDVQLGETRSQEITISYNNTTYNQELKAECSNSSFSIDKNYWSIGEYGEVTFNVSFTATTIGPHSGIIVLTRGETKVAEIPVSANVVGKYTPNFNFSLETAYANHVYNLSDIFSTNSPTPYTITSDDETKAKIIDGKLYVLAQSGDFDLTVSQTESEQWNAKTLTRKVSVVAGNSATYAEKINDFSIFQGGEKIINFTFPTEMISYSLEKQDAAADYGVAVSSSFDHGTSWTQIGKDENITTSVQDFTKTVSPSSTHIKYERLWDGILGPTLSVYYTNIYFHMASYMTPDQTNMAFERTMVGNTSEVQNITIDWSDVEKYSDNLKVMCDNPNFDVSVVNNPCTPANQTWGTSNQRWGQSTVSITYTPTEEGNHTGNIYFYDNKRFITIPVSGEAYRPLNLSTSIDPSTQITKDDHYSLVTLERVFKAGYNTVTIPFDYDIDDNIHGAKAAQLAFVTYNSQDEYTLYLQEIENGKMLANQPYVVYLPSDITNPLQWTDVTVKVPVAGDITLDNWTMQGNYTPGFPMAGNYGIAGGKFCLGTGGSTINAYTAYFTFLGTQDVRARVAVMDEGGNTTYIGELKDGVLQTGEGIYGLDGIQQNQLRKGINIVRMKDGKVRKILK